MRNVIAISIGDIESKAAKVLTLDDLYEAYIKIEKLSTSSEAKERIAEYEK